MIHPSIHPSIIKVVSSLVTNYFIVAMRIGYVLEGSESMNRTTRENLSDRDDSNVHQSSSMKLRVRKFTVSSLSSVGPCCISEYPGAYKTLRPKGSNDLTTQDLPGETNSVLF
jgi:hypothetical protein